MLEDYTAPSRILGPKIRELRKQRGMTLKDLAAQARVSPSFLSEIERMQTVPSIGSIKRLADALGISMGHLFVEQRPDDDLVVRKDHRKTVFHHFERHDVKYHLLAPDGPKQMEPLLGELPPGAATAKVPYSHSGEEWGYVLEGRLSVRVEGREILMEPGDSVYFNSTAPHLLVNRDDTLCRYIWVSMPESGKGKVKP